MNEAFTLMISKRKESANGCFEAEQQVAGGRRVGHAVERGGGVAGSHPDMQFSYY